MNKVLMVHFESEPVAALKQALGNGFVFREFDAIDSVIPCLSIEAPDCVVLCVRENEALPLQEIERIKKFDDNLPVVCVTTPRPVADVVLLMKQGVFDYFHFPLEDEKLLIAVAHACKMYQLTKKIFLLENQMGNQTRFDDMIGASPRMHDIFQMIRSVAKSNATVLILGDSGTGKELVARSIHRHSNRNERRFIDINCGAIPRELLENELFGHERGSFTGADRRYLGCCERADGGTLFLDEISDTDGIARGLFLNSDGDVFAAVEARETCALFDRSGDVGHVL